MVEPLDSGVVVVAGGAGVGVTDGALDVFDWAAVCGGEGDEGVPQDVRAQVNRDSGWFPEPRQEPCDALPSNSLPVDVQERAVRSVVSEPLEPLGHERRNENDTWPVAFANDPQRRPVLGHGEVTTGGVGGFADP